MKDKNVWDYSDYRLYLNDLMGPKGTRSGRRKHLAEALGVHTTFVSQVLSGKVDFSLEQAESVNAHLAHTNEEADYFLLMLLKERAGTLHLKKRFEEKVEKLREERMRIAARVKPERVVADGDREKFYSSYLYGAIHVLTSIPNFQTLDSLASALHQSRGRIGQAVEFMVRVGVLVQVGQKYLPAANHFHLGNDSNLVARHHANWRSHTISKMQFLDKKDIHYSACVTLSKTDISKVKDILLNAIERSVAVILPSQEETAFVFTLDFYELLDL